MIKSLDSRSEIEQDKKLNNKYIQFISLLDLLKKESLSSSVIDSVNIEIEKLNEIKNIDKALVKQMTKSLSHILTLIEKEHKLVTKGHHRNIWLVLGMAAFGIPLGLAFGLSMDNMGLLAIGLPLGIGLGIAVGTSLDNKAYKVGNQLDIEIKY